MATAQPGVCGAGTACGGLGPGSSCKRHGRPRTRLRSALISLVDLDEKRRLGLLIPSHGSWPPATSGLSLLTTVLSGGCSANRPSHPSLLKLASSFFRPTAANGCSSTGETAIGGALGEGAQAAAGQCCSGVAMGSAGSGQGRASARSPPRAAPIPVALGLLAGCCGLLDLPRRCWWKQRNPPSGGWVAPQSRLVGRRSPGAAQALAWASSPLCRMGQPIRARGASCGVRACHTWVQQPLPTAVAAAPCSLQIRPGHNSAGDDAAQPLLGSPRA